MLGGQPIKPESTNFESILKIELEFNRFLKFAGDPTLLGRERRAIFRFDIYKKLRQVDAVGRKKSFYLAKSSLSSRTSSSAVH